MTVLVGTVARAAPSPVIKYTGHHCRCVCVCGKCVFSAVEDTVKAIREAQGLTTLRLSGNSMGVQAAQAIAGGLATQPTLTRALWSNMFVSRVRSEIPPALVTLPVLGISLFPSAVSLSQTSLSEAVMAAGAQLVELDLSDNAFGPVGIQAIYQLLTSPSCHTLRVLKLNNTGIGVAGGEVGNSFTVPLSTTVKYLPSFPSLLQLLADALSQCHDEACRAGGRLQLEVFVLGRSRLENKGASALAEVFGNLSSLLEVSMPQNGINKEGISALATALAKNTQLRVSSSALAPG